MELLIDPVYILLACIGGFLLLVFIVCLFVVRRVPQLDLKDKKVFITGGSEGIGLAMAAECIRKGAYVCISARREDVLKKAVETLAKVGVSENRVHYVKIDVGDEAAVDEAAKQVDKWIRTLPKAVQTSGAEKEPLLSGNAKNIPFLNNEKFAAGNPDLLSPDVVICNAGYSYPARFVDTSSAQAKNQMNVNFFGCVNVVRAFLPSMIVRNSGRFVLVGSMAGQAPLAGFTIYGATKAAIKAFAMAIDMECSPYNVRTQVVFPPDVATPGYEQENTIKSEECKRICALGGATPFTSEEMATSTISSIENYSFEVNLGMDGHLLGLLCSTTEPATSALALFTQFMFGGTLRLVMSVYSMLHYGICKDVKQEQTAAAKKK